MEYDIETILHMVSDGQIDSTECVRYLAGLGFDFQDIKEIIDNEYAANHEGLARLARLSASELSDLLWQEDFEYIPRNGEDTMALLQGKLQREGNSRVREDYHRVTQSNETATYSDSVGDTISLSTSDFK